MDEIGADVAVIHAVAAAAGALDAAAASSHVGPAEVAAAATETETGIAAEPADVETATETESGHAAPPGAARPDTTVSVCGRRTPALAQDDRCRGYDHWRYPNVDLRLVSARTYPP